MQIDQIQIQNFKNFSAITSDFNAGVNLFVGGNMSGKTTLLEAINVAVGCFFGNQEANLQCKITIRDVKITNGIRESITKVEAKDKTNDLTWSRSYKSSTKSNDDKGSYPLKEYGLNFFELFKNPEDRTIAPLIAYYSTLRLFKDSSVTEKSDYDPTKGRKNGYLQALGDKAIKNILKEWLRNAATRRATLQIKEIDKIDNILENVEKAIRICLIDFLGLPESFPLKIYQDPDYNNMLFLQFDNETSLPLSYYSDGFRNLVYLIMDMVWRASQLNPWLTLDEITKQISGVVTIDEIDLHLHPKWQAKAIPLLQKLFPKVQFFITTHSPTVVANFDKGTLYVVDENQVRQCSEKYFGKDIDDILRNILDANDRHIKTQEKLDTLYRLIDEERSEEEINPILSELTEQLGLADPDIQRAKSLMQWNNYKKENPDAVHQ